MSFTCSDKEQNETNQVQPSQNTTQDEHQASNLVPFWDEQASSTGHEDVESDFSKTVGNSENSPNPDSDFQGYYSYGDHSLDDFDLRTPAIPSTPHFYFDDEEVSANYDSYNIASSSIPTEQAASLRTDQFECRECLKGFDDKKKFKTHIKYHDKSLECPDCEMAFGVREQLKRHRKEVHEKQQIVCPVSGCERKYSRLSSVKRHVSNKHGSFDSENLLYYMK